MYRHPSHIKICLSLIFSLLFYSFKFGEGDYSRFVNTEYLNKKIKIKNNWQGFDEVTYLGAISPGNSPDTLFQVVTLFSTVKAAIVYHGHTTVIFFNKNKKEAKRYYLSSPDQLPYKLDRNKLYFHYTDKETQRRKIFTLRIGHKLPRLICVAPDDCY